MYRMHRLIAFLLMLTCLMGLLGACAPEEAGTTKGTETTGKQSNPIPESPPQTDDKPLANKGESNMYTFDEQNRQIKLELCTPRMLRMQYSTDGANGYRPEDPEYYMVQKEVWDAVEHTYEKNDYGMKIRTSEIEIVVNTKPFRLSVYDLKGNLLSKDTAGMYQNGKTVGVKKQEGSLNAGGIFGFGSGDHGRRDALNRYDEDFDEFSMSHGRVIAPFFMSSVGYGIFLNTISENTKFFKRGGGFETEDYLDYFLMYGPDFKTILNEYAELTGRMELYGKWAHGFMLSKYGNDNATQAEFLEWIHRLRDEGFPADCYVFDYGWRGDVNVTKANHSAGQKWGNQMWSNDTSKFPDIDAMFREAREFGFHVGLHNNAGTPEASGGDKLYLEENQQKWVQSYMDSVITTGYGDWFWPDEFDVLGSNSAPVLSAKGAYEAWQEHTVESRPMFMTRGSFAGQHFATAWSGDTDASERDLAYQIGFALDTGLVGYWATSCDLGGFKTRPTDSLYTRWVSEFGAWSAIMRTHGHDGREPWTFDETAQSTLKENLRTRYALYPYIYSSAWQGYSQGTPIMRAMILEDGSQTNPDAWDLNRQYYFGDWFLVAPATEARDTTVSVWFPPNTTWYHYYTGERYEGGKNGSTVTFDVALDEIPVFVKAGAIIPMGPEVNYADEHPLSPLTLELYPKGTSSYTLYEDDGESRRYITANAYATTSYTMEQKGGRITLSIGERYEGNSAVYSPADRSYELIFHHVGALSSVSLDGKTLTVYSNFTAFENAEYGCYMDENEHTLFVKFTDTAKAMCVTVECEGLVEPEEGSGSAGDESTDDSKIEIGAEWFFELENATLHSQNPEVPLYVNTEWKGYTGEGFVKAFKSTGDAISFEGKLLEAGNYRVTLRVGCGKKNAAKYDDTPRTYGLYVDGMLVENLAFEVTDTWGDSNKNGDWREYTYTLEDLSAGTHTFRIVAEGSNPGNCNLDSIRFVRDDGRVDGFAQIAAVSANAQNGFVFTDGIANTALDGAYLGWNNVMADGKKSFTVKYRSTTGGTLTVYETGVGDKILCTVTLEADGEWHTVTVECRDTDADPSPIYLSFVANGGEEIDVSVDWFSFEKE